WSNTVREESVSYDLRQLSSGDISVGSEVGPVLRRYTWLTCSTTRITRHHIARCQPLDEVVEGRSRCNVLECLSRCRLVEPCCIGHNLSHLAACSIGIGP